MLVDDSLTVNHQVIFNLLLISCEVPLGLLFSICVSCATGRADEGTNASIPLAYIGVMATHLETNLGLLQELINKDPESYKEEFLAEYNFYIKTIQLLRLQPSLNHADLQSLLELINFLASASTHYPKEGTEYAASIMEILNSRLTGLDPEIRVAFCKALVILRNRRIVDPLAVMDLFFTLVPCEDKNLRKFICGSIKALIKKLTLQYRDQKMLSKVRTFLFTKLKDSRSIVVRTAELVLIDGFRKGFLKDAKTANALAECCLHKISRIQIAAIRFFLGSLEDNDSDDDESASEEDQKTLKEVVVAYKAAKKTRKKKERYMKAKKLLSKGKKSKNENAGKFCNLLAIRYIYDPQTFAERLFGLLENRKNEKFETRLLCMALCARLIGTHRLQALSFYSYMHRFLQPKQREITRILLYVAQACHELVPPDIIEQLVYVIAQNFVSDRNTPEAVTVGLNTIREIFANCPFAATEDLLRDLTDYKRFKNKNVSMAARGIITLFRAVNPKLLHRKDRGRPTQKLKDLKVAEFGVEYAKEFVEGAECLPVEADAIDRELVQNDESDDTDFDSDFDTEFVEHDSLDSDVNMDSCGNHVVVTDICVNNARSPNKESLETNDQKITFSDTKKKARRVCETRILTQNDFRKINAFRLKQQVGYDGKRRNDDMKLEEELGETIARHNEENGLTRLKDIEKFHKKLRKETKEERVETVKKGREGRQQFGKPKKAGAHVGRTNRELMKRKNFQMVRHKLRGKNRQRSFKDRQESLRKYLLRQAGRKI
uniref:Protein SDA1 n=1 Tax=Brugia malayi TaxID=6279 RepID=A0A0H5S741_BRUMA|nr:BMA-PRO-3 [Brugia malayi]